MGSRDEINNPDGSVNLEHVTEWDDLEDLLDIAKHIHEIPSYYAKITRADVLDEKQRYILLLVYHCEHDDITCYYPATQFQIGVSEEHSEVADCLIEAELICLTDGCLFVTEKAKDKLDLILTCLPQVSHLPVPDKIKLKADNSDLMTDFFYPQRWRFAWGEVRLDGVRESMPKKTWQRRKKSLGGVDHPTQGDRKVSFPIEKLEENGLPIPG